MPTERRHDVVHPLLQRGARVTLLGRDGAALDAAGAHGAVAGRFGVVTLHRPSNVDEPARSIQFAERGW